MKTLNDLSLYEKGKIIDVNEECSLKQRLHDLGLSEGSDIECILDSAKHNPKAYRVKNSVFALRSSLAQYILIE